MSDGNKNNASKVVEILPKICRTGSSQQAASAMAHYIKQHAQMQGYDATVWNDEFIRSVAETFCTVFRQNKN